MKSEGMENLRDLGHGVIKLIKYIARATPFFIFFGMVFTYIDRNPFYFLLTLIFLLIFLYFFVRVEIEKSKTLSISIPAFLSSAMCFFAVNESPTGYHNFSGEVQPGYYAILRLVVFLSMLQITLTCRRHREIFSEGEASLAPFILIAITFNPLFPIRLPKEAWGIIDIFSGAIILVCGLNYCKLVKIWSGIFNQKDKKRFS